MRNKHDLLIGFAGLLIAVSSIAKAQSIEDEFKNPCTSAKTCRECIQIAPNCGWCGMEIYSRELPRCDKLANLKKHCHESDVHNPLSSFQIKRDDALTSGEAGQAPVQVKPQRVEFHLRPNEPKQFNLTFQQQANYPVDLYFLLDLSYGMHREVEAKPRLVALGNDIPVSMADITNNFRLGFGTFVDKSLMPYTAWTEKMLQDRCPLKSKQCALPHDFKNQLSIGFNHSRFARSMEKALETVSQSLDDAEGGLDGLVQALDCDIIGWRAISRRIIVYSSNSLFHLAGAGLLGGATKQSSLKCNLTDDGKYATDKVYDYPSVSQVAQKLREKNANVIFAVMGSVVKKYKDLERFLDGAVVGELESDSKNIVGLIKDKYYELRSRIEFQVSKSTNVEVKFESKCKSDIMKETSVCDDLKIMDSVEFDVTITVDKDICKNIIGVAKKEVILNTVGLNEAVVIDLNVQCSCDCELPSQEITNSVKCSSGNGTFECGICDCNAGRFGNLCECDETELSQERSLENCRNAATNNVTCSGNGECICGVCECLPIPGGTGYTYNGLYCECNDYNCLFGQNKLLCGGPSKGICKCGTCECLPEWSGDNCACATSEDSCVASNGEICNGVGTCHCGRCICNSTSGMLGPTCEDCLTCPSKCPEYVDCAQCRAFQSGSYNAEECESKCSKYAWYTVQDLPSGDGIRRCEGQDSDKCIFYFIYRYSSDNDIVLTIQETKRCPKELPLAAIIGGTISAVILIPLLLICLYIFLRNMKDKQEYAKFLRDKEKARWDTGANPIYKGPTTTFQNLNYQGAKSSTAKEEPDQQEQTKI